MIKDILHQNCKQMSGFRTDTVRAFFRSLFCSFSVWMLIFCIGTRSVVEREICVMSDISAADIFRSGEEGISAVLVAIDDGSGKTDILLDELQCLLETSGGHAYARLVQPRERPDAGTYIGSGKINELKELCENAQISLVVFDAELSPAQVKNIEDGLGGEVTVIDRSMLILDIFALHAVTDEGKLQVELAQLQYTAPRLVGKGLSMSRQGGGNIAARGPGETKLETDRRRIRRRISALKEQLDELEKEREIRRCQRKRSGIFSIAIAGYTNAGKSTLLNYLTGAGILAQDKLFATLDPTTRKYTLPDGTDILLTDTVGFIRRLPHHLVKAFHSTLEEITLADAVLAVADISDPECADQLRVTQELLHDLGADGKPVIYVFNKSDLVLQNENDTLQPAIRNENDNTVYISAETGKGIDDLINMISALAASGKTRQIFEIPNSELGALSALYRTSIVENVEYTEAGAVVTAVVDAKTKGQYSAYLRK